MQPGDSVHVSLLWHLLPDVFSLAQAPVEPWALSRGRCINWIKIPKFLSALGEEKFLVHMAMES